MSLHGKSVLITGAAGRIGSALAESALAAGAEVIITDIQKNSLYALRDRLIVTYGEKIECLPADITSFNQIVSLVDECQRIGRSFTSAVHCAYPTSEGWGARFEELKAENLYKDLTMQLGSAILFSQVVLDYFKSQGEGDLVHISSIQGIRAPKFSHYEGTEMTSPVEYAAIKAGVISITKWLAKYYANSRIRVNCISPGGVIANQPPVFMKRYRESCTNVGMLDAKHVAAAIIYLLSPEAFAINGQNLIIDDGWSL